MKARWLNGVLATAAILVAFGGLAGGQQAQISGVVTDGSKPLAGAVVRLQGTTVYTRANECGEFTLDLSGRITWPFAKVTAYSPGYYIAGPFLLQQGQRDVVLTLKKHADADDPTYEWLSAFSSAGQDANCENCHAASGSSPLPFDEWKIDAHGTSAVNRRFLSMYNGTDLSGENQSPPTRYAFHKDYGRIPLPPDPSLPYFGPGFKLDFPESAGNCAACHLPNAAVRAPYDTNPNTVTGVGKEGVGCDLCHKVWSVKLNPSSGLPYANTPGVLSLEFRRPSQGHQFFAGPFDDVAPGEDTYSPLQNQSQICAPCHFGQFWGVQIYNSFGEWLASPYSDPVKGQTCQDCHMPRRGAQFVARAEKGALLRDPRTIFSHLMPGAADLPLLQDTAKLEVSAAQAGPLVHVTVRVTNAKAGHHIPTDHPSRNMLLIVSASDGSKRRLLPLAGPVVPSWGGVGSAPEDYGGKPGRGFAKILEELWTEVSPTAAYWNPTVLREDTRIPALATDVSEYDFLVPEGGGHVQVDARLVFRRAFRTLQLWKQWNVPDILINQTSVSIDVQPSGFAPLAVVHAARVRRDVPVAPASIITIYGSGLASSVASGDAAASGTRVVVRDRWGLEEAGHLLYVSPGQINLVLPPSLSTGSAVLIVMRDGRLAAAAETSLAAVAPGLFTANGRETGPAAAIAVRVAPDGSQTFSPAFECGAAAQTCVAVPISVNIGRTYLMLFGTGIRGVRSKAAAKVSVGNIEVPVLSVDPQPQFAGLDQVNVELPASLAGRGEVPILLSADGQAANTVFINVR